MRDIECDEPFSLLFQFLGDMSVVFASIQSIKKLMYLLEQVYLLDSFLVLFSFAEIVEDKGIFDV